MGWKWSKPHTPSKPRPVGEARAVDDLREGHPLRRDIQSDPHAAEGISGAGGVRPSSGCSPLNVPHADSQPGTTHACTIHAVEPSALMPPRAAHSSAVSCVPPITTPLTLTHNPMCWCHGSFGPAKPSGAVAHTGDVVAQTDDARVGAVAVEEQHLRRGGIEGLVDEPRC